MQDTLVLREAHIRELPAIAEHWLAMFEANANFREEDFLADWRQRFVAFFTCEITQGEAAERRAPWSPAVSPRSFTEYATV